MTSPDAFRKSRREGLNGGVMVSSSRAERCGRILDRGADLVVRPAAADIAGHRLVDVLVARGLVRGEQRHRAHDLAALAVAALRHVVLDPRRLHRFADAARAPRPDGPYLLCRGPRD